MLLRTIILHFRQQDWRAIFLELVIVVVGIFIGLQANEWYESRQERGLEQQYIAALKSDLRADIEVLDIVIGLAKQRALSGRFVLSAVEKHEVQADPTEFIRAVNETILLTFPSYTKTTINDLTSTGNLQIIQSTALKSMIAAYYSGIDFHQQWRSIWQDLQLALIHTMPQLLNFEHREALSSPFFGRTPWLKGTVEMDAADMENVLERITTHPMAKGQIENMVFVQDNHYMILIVIRGLAAEFLETF